MTPREQYGDIIFLVSFFFFLNSAELNHEWHDSGYSRDTELLQDPTLKPKLTPRAVSKWFSDIHVKTKSVHHQD